MQYLPILLIFGFVLSQADGGILDSLGHPYSDLYHEYRFEYHPNPRVLMIIGFRECYFVRVNSDMESQLRQDSTRYELEAKIYQQIHDHSGEHRVPVSLLASDLHDLVAAFECEPRQVYELDVAGDVTTTPATPGTEAPVEEFTSVPTEDTVTGLWTVF